MAPRETPSMATKMSLLGAWTRTPGRLPAAAEGLRRTSGGRRGLRTAA